MNKKVVWLLYDADTAIGIKCQCRCKKTISDIRRKPYGKGNADSSSYVANKPELGTAAVKNVAEEIGDNDDIPTVAQVNEAIINASVWMKTYISEWAEIIDNDNYANDYQVGKLVDLDFGEYGTHQMELVALDTDVRADGDLTKNNGKAKMTYICKDILIYRAINTSASNANGWSNMAVRSWLRETILPSLPQEIKNNITEVTKTYYNYTTKSTLSISDTIWIPSAREIFGVTVEDSGVDYSDIFSNDEKRIKYFNGSAGIWWLRTAYEKFNSDFWRIMDTGSSGAENATKSFGIVPCFCL